MGKPHPWQGHGFIFANWRPDRLPRPCSIEELDGDDVREIKSLDHETASELLGVNVSHILEDQGQ